MVGSAARGTCPEQRTTVKDQGPLGVYLTDRSAGESQGLLYFSTSLLVAEWKIESNKSNSHEQNSGILPV